MIFQLNNKVEGNEMRKNKIWLMSIIIVALVIVSGIVFLNYSNAGRQDESDKTPDITITQSNKQNQENVNDIQNQELETEQQKEKTVFILTEEEVLGNPVFNGFINKEMPAYDDAEEKKRYIYEYFADEPTIYGVHYMAEDLNQDTKNELLVLIQYGRDGSFGDLYVFEESENGKLIAWEEWSHIVTDRQPDLYYCGNGIFKMDGGGLGISIGHYTQEGNPELLMDWYNEIKECNDTNYVVGISFSLYENGEVTKSMYFEEYYNTKTDEEITELEREEVREGRRLFDEIMASLEEEKKITIDSVEYNDRIGTISLEELLRP